MLEPDHRSGKKLFCVLILILASCHHQENRQSDKYIFWLIIVICEQFFWCCVFWPACSRLKSVSLWGLKGGPQSRAYLHLPLINSDNIGLNNANSYQYALVYFNYRNRTHNSIRPQLGSLLWSEHSSLKYRPWHISMGWKNDPNLTAEISMISEVELDEMEEVGYCW